MKVLLQKAKGMKIMKTKFCKGFIKRFAALFAVIAMCFSLAACGTKLAEGFEEGEVKEAATKFLDHLTAGEYDKGLDMMSDTMQDALPQEDLAAIMEDVGRQAGAFLEYKSIAVVGQSSQGVEYATTVVVASYENRNVTYTVVFNTDMKIDGFFLK